MNGSPFSFCSDAEIGYFRKLVFQSRYLKEAGRMHGGKIDCSTTMGRAAQSQTRFKPDFTQRDGTLVYRDVAPFRIDKQTVITIQLGDSFIVYSPYNGNVPAVPFMHYTVTDVNAPTMQTGRLVGETPDLTASVLTSEGKARVAQSLYATRCTADHSLCMTTYMSVADGLRANRNELSAFAVLSGVCGRAIRFFLLVSFISAKRAFNISCNERSAATLCGWCISRLWTWPAARSWRRRRWCAGPMRISSPSLRTYLSRWRRSRASWEALRSWWCGTFCAILEATMRERPGFRVNVNIAAADLADPTFLPMLEEALAQAKVSPKSLGIEITESYTARQQVAKDTILRLRQRGHFVHIDDFGTGYSSLAYLHDLSVDAIKIDKAFTKAIGTEAVTVSILPQILDMADTLKLRVVVEGIETQEQASYFAAANQRIFAQGWLFGRPVPAESFHRTLAEDEKKNGVDSLAAHEDRLSAPLQIA